jgi:hypothetical protein
MSVRIFCQCGAEVTQEISLWDRKTRSVFWMEQNAPACEVCQRRQASAVAEACVTPPVGKPAGRKLAVQ